MRVLLWVVIPGLVCSLAFGAVAPGWAQERQVEITAPPPERARPPAFARPGQPPEITHPREADFRPDNIRTRHDPAFITPFTTTVRTGPATAVRIGLSGWTAPPGRGDRVIAGEVSGGVFALGMTIMWDVPVEPPKPTTSPAGPPPLR